MSSFEWMELQTLTSEIVAARSRLTAARSSKNVGRARALEQEIAAAEARRTRLLASITINLAATPETAPARPTTKRVVAPVDEPPRHETGAAKPAPANGERIMWERLTPADLARVSSELDRRRAETLERHAAELRDLAADQTEVESLEQAVAAFVRKFNRLAPGDDIAVLDAHRGLRLQAHG